MKLRRKSYVVRGRIRSSRRPNGPSPLSVCHLADDNEEIGSRENDKLIADSDLQCDSGYTDVDFVPNSLEEEHFPQENSQCLGRSETAPGFKPLSLDACIVCGTADESVYSCSGTDCPVSYHPDCLNAEMNSEDPEYSLCPYCSFKNVVHRSKSLAEKVAAAKKQIFKNLDTEAKNSDTEVKETSPEPQENTTLLSDDEHSVGVTFVLSDQELQRVKDACASKEKQAQVDNDSDTSRGQNKKTNQSKDGIEASENEAMIYNIDDFEDAEDDETTKDKTKANAATVRNRDESHFVSTEDTFSGKEQQIGKRRRWVSEVSSNRSSNDHNDEDQISSSVHATSSSDPKGKNITTTEVGTGLTVMDAWNIKKETRKKLYWSAEEEDMLKHGVERYAAEAKKNMPWRKILEMGKKVFHDTRTPADLKDKWRRMTSVSSEANSSKTSR